MKYIPMSTTIIKTKPSERILPDLKPRLYYTLINIRRKKEVVDNKDVIKCEYVFREKPDPVYLKDPRALHVTSFTVDTYEQGDAIIDTILGVARSVATENEDTQIENKRVENRARLNNIATNAFAKRRRR